MKSDFRITPARKALIQIFSDKTEPLTAIKIKSILTSRGLSVNKTTIYRELSFLLSKNLIQKILIDSKKTFYESTKLEHHHHLICNNCGRIEDIVLEKDFSDTEKDLEKKTKFKVSGHSLEFFGLCSSCN